MENSQDLRVSTPFRRRLLFADPRLLWLGRRWRESIHCYPQQHGPACHPFGTRSAPMMSPGASASGRPALATSAAGPVTEHRDVHYAYSESLPAVLASIPGSLLLSTPTTGNVVVVSAPRGQLT